MSLPFTTESFPREHQRHALQKMLDELAQQARNRHEAAKAKAQSELGAELEALAKSLAAELSPFFDGVESEPKPATPNPTSAEKTEPSVAERKPPCVAQKPSIFGRAERLYQKMQERIDLKPNVRSVTAIEDRAVIFSLARGCIHVEAVEGGKQIESAAFPFISGLDLGLGRVSGAVNFDEAKSDAFETAAAYLSKITDGLDL